MATNRLYCHIYIGVPSKKEVIHCCITSCSIILWIVMNFDSLSDQCESPASKCEFQVVQT